MVDSASIAVGANTNPKSGRCAAAEAEIDAIARDVEAGRRVRPELQYRHPGVTAADLFA